MAEGVNGSEEEKICRGTEEDWGAKLALEAGPVVLENDISGFAADVCYNGEFVRYPEATTTLTKTKISVVLSDPDDILVPGKAVLPYLLANLEGEIEELRESGCRSK